MRRKYKLTAPKKTYQFFIGISRILMLWLFILIACHVHAQQKDTAGSGKLSEIDTATESVSPPPEEEVNDEDDPEENNNDTEDDNEQKYFSPKWMTGGPDSFGVRRLSDKAMRDMRDDDAFWYANKVFKKNAPQQQSTSFFDSVLFRTIIWVIIIGGFATFLILYLSGSSVGLFRKSKTIAEAEEEAETEDIFAINYQKEIDMAIAGGNYRLAIRLMFLRLLKNLSDKNIIQFTQEKTNFDYLLQLHGTKWYTNFFRLTRNYEYAWYGQFDIDKEKFNVIRKEFDNFERQL